MPVGGSIAAAGIGAAGSIGGSMLKSGASGQASQTQLMGSMMALSQQQQMFDKANNALSPYYTAGQSALPTLQSLLTPSTASSTLSTLPGFQFQSQWGGLQATNALAAQGLGGSTGPLAKAISDYNQGLAGTYWQNSVNGLQNFANMGNSAATALAGDAIGAGNAMAGTITGGANAAASGILGSANALSSGISGAAGQGGNALLLAGLMNNGSGTGGSGGGGIYGSVGNAAWNAFGGPAGPTSLTGV